MKNPYGTSPTPAPIPHSTPIAQEPEELQDGFVGQLNESRDAIASMSALLGLMAMIATIGFVLNLFQFYPGTETYAIVFAPFWMLMHVIRAVCLSWISWQLWRYQRAIRDCSKAGKQFAKEFVTPHNRFWQSTAVMFIVLAAFTTLSIWFQ